ncbi:MAG: hypothetical protein Q4G48_02480 [Bacteroidia bacterium]|nr:hypothetical protein [Bacteroidia bacterium]
MKKYGIFLLLFLFTTTSALFFSCSKEDSFGEEDSLELQSPYGSWALEKYISAGDSKSQWSAVSRLSNFHLTLNQNNTFTGSTSNNRISGSFIYDINQRDDKLSFSETISMVTNNKENSDGDLYLKYLKTVKSFRKFYDSKKETRYLHLYLTDKKDSYLEYKEVEPIPLNKR